MKKGFSKIVRTFWKIPKSMPCFFRFCCIFINEFWIIFPRVPPPQSFFNNFSNAAPYFIFLSLFLKKYFLRTNVVATFNFKIMKWRRKWNKKNLFQQYFCCEQKAFSISFQKSIKTSFFLGRKQNFSNISLFKCI